jgi:hypothetical protein
MRILLQADDGDLSAALLRHGGAEDADGAGAEHDDAVARFDAGVFDHGIVSHTARLGEAGLLERKLIRHMVQNAARTRTYFVIAPFTP